MKKSILTLAIFALSFTNNTAKATTTNSNLFETTTALSRDQITEVYDWSVKTTQRNYSGTANSLEEANKIIALVTLNEVILDKKIESFYQVKNQEDANNKRLYFWEAQTDFGYAKGFSNSENQAKKMIDLIGKGDVLNYKIIQSIKY
jgi:hypothetical protein